jgi:hypothetical protein
MSPHDSDDLTTVVIRQGAVFVVFRSSDFAEANPRYELLAKVPALASAEAYLAAVMNCP